MQRDDRACSSSAGHAQDIISRSVLGLHLFQQSDLVTKSLSDTNRHTLSSLVGIAGDN